MNVTWVKCGPTGASFCPLETVDLSEVDMAGVYIIWHNVSTKVVYVGATTDIARRLAEHRANPSIINHRGNGLLLVTWARIENEEARMAVERYLHDQYSPVESTSSHFRSEPVNLPQ